MDVRSVQTFTSIFWETGYFSLRQWALSSKTGLQNTCWTHSALESVTLHEAQPDFKHAPVACSCNDSSSVLRVSLCFPGVLHMTWGASTTAPAVMQPVTLCTHKMPHRHSWCWWWCSSRAEVTEVSLILTQDPEADTHCPERCMSKGRFPPKRAPSVRVSV